MQRPTPDRVIFDPAEFGAVLTLALEPWDAAHPPVVGFPPALAALAGLGHLLRERIDRRAWVREATFEIDIHELGADGDPVVIDRLATDLRHVRPHCGTRLVFRYRDFDRDGYARYAPENLWHLDPDDLDKVADADTQIGDAVFAMHAANVDRALEEFLSERLDLTVRTDFALTWKGAAYDHGADHEGDRKRSELEDGSPASPARRRFWPFRR